MKFGTSLYTVLLISLVIVLPGTPGISEVGSEADQTDARDGRVYYWSNPLGYVLGVTPKGQVAALEMPAGYEHIQVGNVLEGYSLCYDGDYPIFDVYQYDSGDFRFLDSWSTRPGSETYPGPVITQMVGSFSLLATRNLSHLLLMSVFWNPLRAGVHAHMTVINISDQTLDLTLKRHADLDVDTGGSSGWADYQNHFEEEGTFVLAYTTDPPEGSSAHIIKMDGVDADVANVDYWDDFSSCPSESALDPPTTPVMGDYMATLEWNIGPLGPGEVFDCGVFYSVTRLE